MTALYIIIGIYFFVAFVLYVLISNLSDPFETRQQKKEDLVECLKWPWNLVSSLFNK